MKIRTKIAKLQMHENLYKNVNEITFSFTFLCIFSEFFEGQLKQQICWLYTANFYMVFNPFKMSVQFYFRLHQLFPKSLLITRPHSTVGNVSGNRCESDCRSRGRELALGLVPYFPGD